MQIPYILIAIIVLAIISAVVIYAGRNRLKQATQKENKAMFWIGIVVVAISIIFFLTEKGEMENKMWAIPIWMVGIGLIAGSRYKIIK